MTRRGNLNGSITHLVSDVECGSDHYRVDWTINPPVRPGAVCRSAARAQHERYRSTLRSVGASVGALPFLPGLYDSVFVKDVALLGRSSSGALRALLARPRHPQRAGEVSARADALEREGFRLAHARHPLEGGDVLWTGRRALVGHGFRSDRRAAREVAAFAHRPALPLQLVDPAFYHLDTALAYLSGGELLVAEGAIARHDLVRLHDLPEVTAVVTVPRAAAMRFALNFVQVGRRVVLAEGGEWVAERLAVWGYEPTLVPLDQYHLAGGSAACLVAEIVDDAAATVSHTSVAENAA